MRFLLTLILTLACLQGLSGQTATGTVYADKNRNGRCDKDEKGIPQVGLSNGREVVLTDRHGRYSIALPENSILFVVKPADFHFPLNAHNLPQYYYRHYPTGSRGMRLSGTGATGPLPAAIDFGLIPLQENPVFKAVIFGDTQVRNLEEIDYLSRDVVAELAGRTDLAFGTVLGDLVFDNADLYSPLNQVMAALGIPLHHAPGNHDMDYIATSDSRALETFQAIYGPKNFSFNVARVHFVVLDNIIYSGDTITHRYEEGFDDELIAFLTSDLHHVPGDNLVVLMMHAPFLNTQNLSPIKNLDKLLNVLSRFPHTFSLSGHSHVVSQQIITRDLGWKNDKPHHHFNAGAACGNWWQGTFDEYGIPDAMMHDGSPNGYAILSFDNNSCRVDYKVARRPADYQMNICTPATNDATVHRAADREVYVNFFTGSVQDRLNIRFDDGTWHIMVPAPGPDPVYTAARRNWEVPDRKPLGKMPSRPVNTAHLWKAPMPGDLKPGMHKVEVVATDLFGKEHAAFHFFRVE